MRRTLVTAEHVHGKTGLDGPDLPDAADRRSGPSTASISSSRRSSRTRRRPSRSATLGPLTNVAMAMVKAPQIIPRIKEIVMMGGGYFEQRQHHARPPSSTSTSTPTPPTSSCARASRSPWCRSTSPTTMLSTKDAPRPLPRARQQVRRRRRRHAGLLRALRSRQSTAATARPLHDPCVIAFLLKPELFKGRHVNCHDRDGERADRGHRRWSTTGASPTGRRTCSISGAAMPTGSTIC